MATANSLIHAFKRAAAVSSTSLLSKLAPTSFLCMFNGRSDDPANKDGLMYVRMEIPELKNKQAALISVEQNTMIIKDKNSGSEIERRLISDRVGHGTIGEIENGTLSLWLPGLLSRLNGEEKIPHDDEVTTGFDEYEKRFYAQVKMPGLEEDHYKLSFEQNKMIIKEQGSEGKTASAMFYLPPNLHRFNGIKGEMKDGVCSLWLPKEV